MRKIIKKKLKNLKRNLNYLRLPKAIEVFFYELFNINKLIKIDIAGESLLVRTNTSDILVAETCLIKDVATIPCTPKIVLDLGANIGATSIHYAKLFKNAIIYAIEPENENYLLLLKNVSKYKNIVPVKAAVHNENGIRSINNRFTGPWGYTITDTTNIVEDTGQRVQCLTIETFMERYNLKYIDIIKMDIEGSEKDLFESSEGWINSVGIITVELHDRIKMGCTRAFYLATKDFEHFEKNGEKITAYRTKSKIN